MKLGKCKQALSDLINANGGWVDVADCATQDKDGWVCSYEGKPTRCGDSWIDNGDCLYKYGFDSGEKIQNWHQCVLSREEYYQAYPKADADGLVEWNGVAKSPVGKGVAVDVKMKNGTQHFGQLIDDECWGDHLGDASIIAYRPHKLGVKPEFCESVMRSIPEQEAKPTIEQLALDYRNKLDYANRKQQEADDAKVAADAALGELERAGEALGLLIGIAKPDQEPELAITDWRDLLVGDVIFVDEYDGHESGEYVVVSLEDDDYDGDYAVMATAIDGCDRWIDTTVEWRFIRRP